MNLPQPSWPVPEVKDDIYALLCFKFVSVISINVQHRDAVGVGVCWPLLLYMAYLRQWDLCRINVIMIPGLLYDKPALPSGIVVFGILTSHTH